jgi:hypothetical protein
MGARSIEQAGPPRVEEANSLAGRDHTWCHTVSHTASQESHIIKDRITITVERGLLKALDAAPGVSRSEKVERLLAEALAGRAHRRWVSELRAFYKARPDAADREEDLDWQSLATRAFEGED